MGIVLPTMPLSPRYPPRWCYLLLKSPRSFRQVCSPNLLLTVHNRAGLWWGEVEVEPCTPEQLSSSTSLLSGMAMLQHHAPSLGLAPAQDTLLHLTGFAALPLHPYPKTSAHQWAASQGSSTGASGTEQPISLPQ